MPSFPSSCVPNSWNRSVPHNQASDSHWYRGRVGRACGDPSRSWLCRVFDQPKQVDRFRDRFTVAGAKDDARDSLVLASSLYTDRQSYRRVEIDSPDLIRLRELSRFEDELKIELRRVTNRLWQQLHRYYPQLLAISPAADDRLMWDLLEAAPTPAEGARMSSLRIKRIFKANRNRKIQPMTCSLH